MSTKDAGKPPIGQRDEVTFAGISLKSHDRFDPTTKKNAQMICEHIAEQKDEILRILKFIDKTERKTKRSLEVVLYLTDPEDDQERWRRKRPENPASGYSLNIHFVDTWKQRTNIYESYEISIEREMRPTAVYVHMRYLDKTFGR